MIWALSPAIPSGFWMKSIVGNDRISPSRTIAKCWRLGARELVGPDLAAAGELARDLVELVAALVGELQRHDRLAGLAEVGARAAKLEIVADHLRDGIHGVVRPVLEEVVERPRRADAAWTEIGRRAARDDDAVPGTARISPPLRKLAVRELAQQLLLCRLGPGDARQRVVVRVPGGWLPVPSTWSWIPLRIG